MCFAQRPSIPIFEIHHMIQCHEDIWNAPNAEEWRRRQESMPVNKSAFPWLVFLMTSNEIIVPPPDLTVLGAFCILHGIPPTLLNSSDFEPSTSVSGNNNNTKPPSEKTTQPSPSSAKNVKKTSAPHSKNGEMHGRPHSPNSPPKNTLCSSDQPYTYGSSQSTSTRRPSRAYVGFYRLGRFCGLLFC
jgi:hypothetical protein